MTWFLFLCVIREIIFILAAISIQKYAANFVLPKVISDFVI